MKTKPVTFQIIQARIVCREQDAKSMKDKLSNHVYLGGYGLVENLTLDEPTPQELRQAESHMACFEDNHQVGDPIAVTKFSKYQEGRILSPRPVKGTQGTVVKIEHGSPCPYVCEFKDEFKDIDGKTIWEPSKDRPITVWLSHHEIERDPATTCIGAGI